MMITWDPPVTRIASSLAPVFAALLDHGSNDSDSLDGVMAVGDDENDDMNSSLLNYLNLPSKAKAKKNQKHRSMCLDLKKFHFPEQTNKQPDQCLCPGLVLATFLIWFK